MQEMKSLSQLPKIESPKPSTTGINNSLAIGAKEDNSNMLLSANRSIPSMNNSSIVEPIGSGTQQGTGNPANRAINAYSDKSAIPKPSLNNNRNEQYAAMQKPSNIANNNPALGNNQKKLSDLEKVVTEYEKMGDNAKAKEIRQQIQDIKRGLA